MPDRYITRQGDTWDLIAYNLFGSETYMRYLIEANWRLLDTLVFPSGVEITVPEIPEEIEEDLPDWRWTNEDELEEETVQVWEDEDEENYD